MPPKLKKLKKVAPPVSTQTMSSNMQNTKSGLDIEAENRFELELYWCIQQIEASLGDNIKQKQAESVIKSLNVLKSSNSSLIKKRQVMRNVFGDYRQKMVEDEKKFGKTSTTLKFIPANKTSQKSTFLKKANKHTLDLTKENVNATEGNKEKIIKTGIVNVQNNGEPFKFNFTSSEIQ